MNNALLCLILMKIIVLDGNENQAVACVRSLARAGHQVVVGAPTARSKAGWSCYCERTFVYPAPDVSEFVERIVQETRREPGALVMPMTERTPQPQADWSRRRYSGKFRTPVQYRS
jgi:thiamine monophosphate kinase